MGYEPYENNIKFPPTEILTVYACPEELNYPQIRQNGWFNLEAFNKVDASGTVAKLEDILPKEFMENNLNGTFSGKYIYFSLGSMVSAFLKVQIISYAFSPLNFRLVLMLT